MNNQNFMKEKQIRIVRRGEVEVLMDNGMDGCVVSRSKSINIWLDKGRIPSTSSIDCPRLTAHAIH